jgi:hypothetical protein
MRSFHSLSSKIIVLIFIIILVGIIGSVYYNNTNKTKNTQFPVPQIPIIISPTPITSEVLSPNGDKKLVMESVSHKDNSITYVFSIKDTSGMKRALFSKTVGSKETMTLPDNSWSPDDVYAFIQENEASDTAILVFKTSGETFTNGDQTIDVSSLLHSKTGNFLHQASGWVSPIFLHITTTIDRETKGPSYWFDVLSQGFLPSW